MLSWLSRLKVTLILAAALAAVAFALLHFGPKFEAKVIRSASTNLHNLGEGRIGTLISSAFVNPVDSIQIWLPGVVAVLALGELLWHSSRLRVAFAVGHIGATLLVAAGLAAALALGSAVLDGGDFTAVGHALALILGMGVGTRFAQPVHWTLTRYLLLVMAGGFGYLLIAAGQGLRTVVAIGLLGAALAQVVSVIWKVVALSQPNSSALASIQSDSHV